VSCSRWHSPTLKAERDQFTATFDDKPILEATHRTLFGSGKVALWTKADTVTSFDAISIRPLP
jgi:hypothetical protein